MYSHFNLHVLVLKILLLISKLSTKVYFRRKYGEVMRGHKWNFENNLTLPYLGRNQEVLDFYCDVDSPGNKSTFNAKRLFLPFLKRT